MPSTLSDDKLRQIDAWWRAANYLSIGQIYLMDNPLLREPLTRENIKPRLLGHWGTTPGLNFIYVHLNRMIIEQDLNVIYVTGPGHGGPGLVANTYLEGTYSEFYPNIPQTEAGMRRLFTQFSFPGGIPSHVAPETPGSINEGGELGYSLLHAYGAVFDNPDLLACCVVGDGEAETGPLATSWHSNKFLNPARDGAVLPILHLNGYKIAGPTVLARMPRRRAAPVAASATATSRISSTGDDPAAMHQLMARTLDTVIAEIRAIQHEARDGGFKRAPGWPMIVLRSPKGWTGPKVVDGQPVEGTFRAHQVPLDGGALQPRAPAHAGRLDAAATGRRSCSTPTARLQPDIAALAPKGDAAHGRQPARQWRAAAARPGNCPISATTRWMCRSRARSRPKPRASPGQFLRDVMRLNAETKNFRVMGPDETASNRLGALFEVTNRESTAEILPSDDHVAPDGRVMEVLSEHMCQGWLEGYLLTGRHGFFSCYEAFIHIIDSMFNQHAKWLKTSRAHPLAAADRLAELPAHLACLAAGPQRLQPPGPRLHRPRGEQEGRCRARLSAARRQHAALRHRPLPAQPQLRQRHRRGQAAGAAVARYGCGDPPLHRGHSASGPGPATMKAWSPTW